MTKEGRTGLVTGANSGLGLEAAAQLAEQGYSRVIITARNEEKASVAAAELSLRTGRDVFETLTLDNAKVATVEAAAATLAGRGGKIDVLILNAGIAPTKELSKTDDGIELTVAASLTGHHVLTMRLLEHGLLSEDARIVIAGSEAARDDVPMMNVVDLDAMAEKSFGGDIEGAIRSQVRLEAPATYTPNDQYAIAKVFVAWWAAELARKLPEGMTVNAVSPGSTPDTNGAKNAPFFMKYLMMPVLKLIPGMSHSVATGASRYLEIAHRNDASGKFFASKPKKMTGPLHVMEMDHLDHPEGQKALWKVTEEVSGGVGYPV